MSATHYFLPLLWLLLLFHGINGLSCYICGDSNLDEFGECSRQFQYDCSSYAKRFSPEERIFCRTTRHKEPNGTYTIMKECMSEYDHYQAFPRKNYQLDEECDLIEIDGKEIAYCLCRHNNFCNEKPIADQFIAFEELHPELFGEQEEEVVQGVANVPIQPVNQPTTAEIPVRVPEAPRRVTISMSDRRQQQAHGTETAEIDPSLLSNSQSKNESTSDGVSTWDMASQGGISFVGQAPAFNKGTKEMSTEIATDDDGFASSFAGTSLTCMQCAQGTLKDEQTDCDRQSVVNCDTVLASVEKTYCLTRQVLIKEGKNAVEKMCITSKSLTHVFGNRVTPGGCTHLQDENVRICVCDTPLCNQEPIFQQILVSELRTSSIPETISSGNTALQSNTPPKRCYVCSENALQQEGEDCMQPVVVDCARQVNYETNTYCLTRQTELSKGVFSLEKLCVTEKQFEEDFPEENGLKMGCYEMFDGMIKYCVCDGDFCNQNSLSTQMINDQNYNSRTTTTTETAIQLSAMNSSPSSIIQPGSAVRRTSPNERQLNEYSQSLFQEIEQRTTATTTSSYHSSLKAKLQESLLNERQNRWKETDDERSNNNNGSLRIGNPSAAFILVTTIFFTLYLFKINQLS